MNAELTPALAFLAGLSGAGHCWAMCGGIAGGAFMACAGRSRRVWPHLGYHGGRVLAYTLLGGLAAGIGQAIVLTGGVGRAQGVLYVLAGLAVILAGLKVMGFLSLPWVKGMWARGGFAMRRCPSPQPSPRGGEGEERMWFLAGFLNGLMPCALVFSLTLKAATAPSVLHGAGWLFAFGLGTVPAMLLASILAHWLGERSHLWLRRGAGLLVVVLGVQAVLAGAEFFRVMLHL
jgi:sulfite exporter TauE/SafE